MKEFARADNGKTSNEPAVASTGFVGLRLPLTADGRKSITRQKALSMGFRLIEWDGMWVYILSKYPSPNVARSQGRPLLDRCGRVFAVLAGSPKDAEQWSKVLEEAQEEMEKARAAYKFDPKKTIHRRGKYATITCGISYGGGQRVGSAK